MDEQADDDQKDGFVLIAVQTMYTEVADKPIYLGQAIFEFDGSYRVRPQVGTSNIFILVHFTEEGGELIAEFDAHPTRHKDRVKVLPAEYDWLRSDRMSLTSYLQQPFAGMAYDHDARRRRIAELNVPYPIAKGSDFFDMLSEHTVREPIILK